MTAAAPLQADRGEIERFVRAIFPYAEDGGYVSLRAFYDDESKVFAVEVHLLGGELEPLVEAAFALATRAARTDRPVVFAPPLATFDDPGSAAERHLANGLALSVECDSRPEAARARLEALLGPATIVVASGGEWIDPETGEVEQKLHLHWRLNEPTRDAASHAVLKRARSLATALVGGDPSGTPAVHPMRWPGSWHRKGPPRLARIVSETEHEIDLDEALVRLDEAWQASRPADDTNAGSDAGPNPGAGEGRSTPELVAVILSGRDYHAPLTALAMRYLQGGMADAQVVLTLRGFMNAVPVEIRDIKDGTLHTGRWQARYDDIPRAVSTARQKLGGKQTATDGWPDPVDFLGSDTATGVPVLRPDHLPDALAPVVFDAAERMGVDPAAMALAVVVAVATVIDDEFKLQPKRLDDEWVESPRLWGAIVGDPSIRKSPIIAAATRPLVALEAGSRAVWDGEMRAYKVAHARWKKQKNSDPANEPARPILGRVMIEDTTTEALSEVLRVDPEATMRAPSGKVLVRQDELSEFLANLDRYRAGGGGGGDRGAYLRLYNGGAFAVDRIKRGTLTVPNWSATFLGGIQPEPIQRVARDAADDGLLQRFMFVVPGATYPSIDRRPDLAARQRYEALFPLLIRKKRPARLLGSPPAVLTLHEDAQRHRQAIEELAEVMKAMPDASSKLRSALGKWPGLFARLTAVFHLVNLADAELQGEELPGDPWLVPATTTAKVASYMQDIVLPHLLRADAIMYLTPQTGHARWIAGHILAHGLDRITRRDVVRNYGALRATERQVEIGPVMESLVTLGWLAPEPSLNAAKQPIAWQVNPKVHSGFAARAAAERASREEAQAATAEAIRRRQAA